MGPFASALSEIIGNRIQYNVYNLKSYDNYSKETHDTLYRGVKLSKEILDQFIKYKYEKDVEV